MEPTVDSAVERFLGQIEGTRRRPFSANTLAAYRRDLAQFQEYISACGTASWQVDGATLLEFRQWLRDREFAPATQARKLAAVKSFYAFLVREGHVKENPAAALSGPQVEHHPPETLADEELGALLAAAGEGEGPESLRDRAMLTLLCATGLRASELMALDVGDVGTSAQTVVCRRPRRASTVLSYDDHVAAVLEAYLAHGRPKLAQDHGETALFLNHRGGRLTRQGFWLLVKAMARLAGVEDMVSPRTLRHTAAATMLRQGHDLAKVQRDLGHASRASTRVYAQLPGDGVAGNKPH